MAYTTGSVSAAELADLAADYPVFLGQQVLAAPVAAHWQVGTTVGTIPGSNDTAVGYPVARAGDRSGRLITKANATSTAHSLVFQVAPCEIDCFAIIGHNWGAGNGVIFVLQIADDANFTTNLINVRSGIVAANNYNRIALENFAGTDARYANVEFFRLQIAASASFVPEIGELWVGRRRQLSRNVRVPADRDRLTTDVRELETRSGNVTRYIRHRAASRRNIGLTATSQTERDTLVDLYRDAEYGTGNVLFWEEPNTDFNKVRVMEMKPDFSMPFVYNASATQQHSNTTLELAECPPFLETE
jgi:hypothetical protein